MRRLVMIPVLLLVVATSSPAGAASEQFFEVPVTWDIVLPNPCTGDSTLFTFEGTIYVHEVTRRDVVHITELWLMAGETDDGYSASLRRSATNTFREGNPYVSTLTGNYLFRHDDGSKFRWHAAGHVTVIDGEVIVAFDMPWQTPPEDLLYCVGG